MGLACTLNKIYCPFDHCLEPGNGYRGSEGLVEI
jgi:hypothetical protein